MSPMSEFVKGFGCRPMPSLSACTAGRRPKAAGEGTRGELGTPETAQRYEDFEEAAGVCASACMTEVACGAAQQLASTCVKA